MDEAVSNNFLKALHEGVIPATGCTEPVAVAFGAATCVKYLSTKEIDKIIVNVSLNIMKNAMAVTVPGTGECGLKVAAASGALIGDPDAGLKVISNISESDLPNIRELAHSGKITINQAKVPDDLYVDVTVISASDCVKVSIAGDHTNIFQVIKNNQTIFQKTKPSAHAKSPIKEYLQTKTFQDIWNFALNVPLAKIQFMKQASILNLTLAEEGLNHPYGIRLGQTLLHNSHSLEDKILAYTAAASDARMGGATLAAMSNSGSGNQGITATIPVCLVSKNLQSSDEELIRALTLSHLTALYIHSFLPVLSAFCATDSAAMGSATGIIYLKTHNYDMVTKAIMNMAGDAVGMVCDGAGCSCAMKVSSSISSMLRSVDLALNNIVIPSNNGLVCSNIDQTIRNIGKLGTDGLKETDPTIVQMMVSKNS